MPFVQISISSGFDDAAATAISGGVHRAMVDTINVPPNDRFQILNRRAPGEMIWDRTFLDVERSDRAVFVHITLSAGRDDAKKRALYRAIVANLTGIVRPQDVLIVLGETSRSDWSFGNGEAQYAPAEALLDAHSAAR